MLLLLGRSYEKLGVRSSPFKVLTKKSSFALFKNSRVSEKPGFSQLSTEILDIPPKETRFLTLVATPQDAG
jgi:hypothetical protein